MVTYMLFSTHGSSRDFLSEDGYTNDFVKTTSHVTCDSCSARDTLSADGYTRDFKYRWLNTCYLRS